ncbi:MAG: hypothetical protein JNM25_10450 [Planctomycetes bacterium]|nr:hypothetical protein [Planctomycetota bacterium]
MVGGGGERQRRFFGGGAVLAAVLGAVVWWLGRGEVPVVALASRGAAVAPTGRADPARMAWSAAVGDAVPEVVPERTQGDPAEVPLAPVVAARVAVLVADLRDDGLPWNAENAVALLVALPRGALPVLDEALSAGDLQQRHLAARVLRRRSEQHAVAPSPRLLEVTVDALSDRLTDELQRRRLCGTWDPAAEGTRFLAPHASAARVPLRRALHVGDGQQRFLAAWLLAQCHDEGYSDTICRELLPHLADNDIAGDAVMATHGLYQLGPAALPALRWWRPHVDAQARRLIDVVERDLQQPPRSRAELERRRPWPRVSNLYHDPAIEFDVHRSRVPSWRSW